MFLAKIKYYIDRFSNNELTKNILAKMTKLNCIISPPAMASLTSHWPGVSQVLLLSLLILLSLPAPSTARTSYSRCLRSCVHCKEMYGQYFLGHLCAQTCISKHGNFRAVCTDITSIKPFLDLASIMDYDYDDEVEM